MELPRRPWKRGEPGGASWVVSGIGVVLAGLSLWYLIVFKALSLPGADTSLTSLMLQSLEVLLLGGFSIVLVYAGYWLATTRFDSRKMWWAGLWTIIGLAGIVGIVALVQSTQIQAGQPIDEPTLIEELLLAAGGGGIAGLLIGVSTVQAMWNEEQAARQRDTLEFMNELLRHNVLNGMQVMLAYTELLREEVDNEEALDHIDTVHKRGEDVVDLVENVRVLARSVSGEVEMHAVDLPTVVSEEVDRARDSYEDATVEADLEADIEVRADELLGAVFENLLTNAVEHNDTDHPYVRVTATAAEGKGVVTVADDGPGIPDEFKESYFGPGEQNPESVGQGLGLYLVDTLVTRYDGDVWVEDNDPRGAVFTVELELAD